MRRLLVLTGGLVAAAVIAGPAAALDAARQPVPSLTPAATQQLWAELVRRPRIASLRTAECRPLRAVFYAPTDWRRLATRLASTPSACGQYYVSIPPVGDKTQPRGDEAWRIRALGPAFHALAEINVTGWTAWVAATGNSWYEAGVEARRRMAATGYDVTAGDTWALNELSSAVRQGTGNARANMRAFLNGLYDGDGALPPARGTVFVAGIGQATTDLSLYQARLQDWYEDSAFWSDLGRFASDWSQEVYGDVRQYAVAGLTQEARRDLLNEYIQHQRTLAGVAPGSAAAAQSFLAASYSPLANAAWRYDAAFGWTDVPVELMQDYVSAQTYAMRSAGNDHFGYAWSPKNLAGIPTADFNAQTDAVLVRLAAAIADSSDVPEAACGTTWCSGSLGGASATAAWRTFGSWKPSRLAFTSPEQTVAPGAASTPLTVELETNAGTPYTAGLPVTVAISSSSATGELSASPSGPWSATLATPIASGASTASFYFRDTVTGSTTITAAAAGKTAATQTVSVGSPVPPPPQTSPPASGGAGPRSRSRRAGGSDARRTGRRRHDHVRSQRPEPRRPGVAGVPRRPAAVTGRVRRQRDRPRTRLRRCGDARMRPRLPLRRPRRDRTDQCRCARGRDAHHDGCCVGSARRRAAVERHRSRRHGRRATTGGRNAHADPSGTSRCEGSCASDAGARRCGPVRPLLGRRRRAARGAGDAAPLDSPADAARRHDARGSGHDEATTDGRPPESRARPPTSSRHGSPPPSCCGAGRTSSRSQ